MFEVCKTVWYVLLDRFWVEGVIFVYKDLLLLFTLFPANLSNTHLDMILVVYDVCLVNCDCRHKLWQQMINFFVTLIDIASWCCSSIQFWLSMIVNFAKNSAQTGAVMWEILFCVKGLTVTFKMKNSI